MIELLAMKSFILRLLASRKVLLISYVWCTLLLCTVTSAVAQYKQIESIESEELKSMLRTEFDFIAAARKQSTRAAFLAYLTDETIMFSGPQAVKGKKLFEDRQEDESLLAWEPDFADIAGSGDFGYDTGPSSYRKSRTDEKPLSFGSFVSVWKKQPDGNWKLAIDIGIYPQPSVGNITLKTSGSQLLKRAVQNKGSKEDLIRREIGFIHEFEKKAISAYQASSSNEVRLYRMDHAPAVGLAGMSSILKWQHGHQKIKYHVIDGECASSGDLGYVYGSATIEAVEGSAEKIKANYLRIWKKEQGENWKMVVDVVSQ
jgi:ketosteroid isomerase-like protein